MGHLRSFQGVAACRTKRDSMKDFFCMHASGSDILPMMQLLKIVLFKLIVQGSPADTQYRCGPPAIVARPIQSARNHGSFCILKRAPHGQFDFKWRFTRFLQAFRKVVRQ